MAFSINRPALLAIQVPLKSTLKSASRRSQTLIVILFVAIFECHAENRLLIADWNQIKGPTTQLFHDCIGAGRANEGLRADWQRQLKLCQDEIGFRQIRFHGLLSDDMGVYTETAGGQPRHNWE